MMKVFVALLFIATAFAQSLDYTGYFINSANNYYLPEDTSDGNGGYHCAAGTSVYNAVVTFNGTFATAGVRYIQVIGGYSSVYVAAYTGAYDPANPCSNVIPLYNEEYYTSNVNDNTEGLRTTAAFYTPAGLVTFVLVSSYGSTFAGGIANDPSAYQYVFGAKVWDAAATTQITNLAGPTWGNPYTDSSSSVEQADVSSRDSSEYVYTQYTWTATETGLFDVGVFIANSSASYDPEAVLGFFSGVPTTAQIEDVTTATGTNYFPYDNDDHQGVFVFAVSVVAGQQYTFVASNGEGEAAYYGFFAIPTSFRPFEAAGPISFVHPDRDSAPDYANEALATCESSEENGPAPQNFAVRTWTAIGSIVIVATPEYDFNQYMPNEFTSQDYETYLYRSVNNTNPSVPCPLTGSFVGAVDSSELVDLNAGASVGTAIVSYYYSSATPDATDGAYILAFYGQSLNGPAAATPAPATPAPATPAPTTSTPTTSTPTTSTPTTSTPTVTPAPTACPTSNYVALISFTAPGGCNNASAQAYVTLVNTAPVTATNSQNATCVNSGTTSTITVTGKICTSEFNVTALNDQVKSLFQNTYGFTGVTVQANIVTSAPTTSTPTTSSPSTATTSDATAVFVSVAVVISAVLGLFL